MHQSERPSTMLVILLRRWLASTPRLIASRAACLKPSTDTNHCTRSPHMHQWHLVSAEPWHLGLRHTL